MKKAKDLIHILCNLTMHHFATCSNFFNNQDLICFVSYILLFCLFMLQPNDEKLQMKFITLTFEK